MQLEDFEISRGFQPGELAQFSITVERGEVIIPILGRNGAWYERIHRPHGQPKYETPKGVETRLYNPLGLGPHSPEVWLAEGEFDALSLVVAGVPAVGIPGANTFTSTKAQVLRLLFEGAEIVLALDPDDAGNTACEKLAQLWDPAQVSRFDPSPYGDLNEFFKDDREGFTEAVLSW